MLSLPSSVKIFLCLEPADMRRSFDGLFMMTEKLIRQDPFTGHLFVFFNKRRDRVKILYWDRDGLAIWYKRLEKGTFRFESDGHGGIEIEPGRLLLILEGIDPAGAKKRKRYSRKAVDERQISQ